MGDKILVIEDDEDIRQMLCDYFIKDGYSITEACNGLEGLEKFKSVNPHIVLLDVMMPVMDGYKFLKKLRTFSNVPVIMLTAKGEQMDKILGFNKGCDDYVVKPFDLIELSLRVKAILRRGTQVLQSSNIMYKDLEIDEKKFKVLRCSKEIKLTKKEFDILILLLKNQDIVFSTENIYEKVWQEEYMENDNSVLTHMRNLRSKLGDDIKNPKYIKTIWGVGYKIEKDS
ncbi:MAG: response regulator transcription factor [Clostridiales bacterium]|nr:response regulator transcription factor [Clostridiales bacterium]NLK24933.1 response regulator transcription factor [Clostridiales bacterium]